MTSLEAGLIFHAIDTPALRNAFAIWLRSNPGKTLADMLRQLADSLDGVAPSASPR